MNSLSRNFLFGMVALGLAGCSGGVFVKTVTRPVETGPVPVARAVPTAPFAPNYRPELREGFYWAKAELNLYFVNGSAAQQETVRAGADLWSGYPGSPFTFKMVSDPTSADVTVSFVSASTFTDGSAGVTTMYPKSGSLELDRAEVEIRSDVTGENLKTLSAHELGHALGIDGHSAASADCMNEYAPNPGRVTQADANTLAFIYDEGTRSASRATRAAAPRTIVCR